MNSESESDSESDSEDYPASSTDTNSFLLAVIYLKRKRRKTDESEESVRARNKQRDREHASRCISAWPDAMFYRQFRIHRSQFILLRESLKVVMPPVTESMAKLSSGSMISLEIKMFITLRL